MIHLVPDPTGAWGWITYCGRLHLARTDYPHILANAVGVRRYAKGGEAIRGLLRDICDGETLCIVCETRIICASHLVDGVAADPTRERDTLIAGVPQGTTGWGVRRFRTEEKDDTGKVRAAAESAAAQAEQKAQEERQLGLAL